MAARSAKANKVAAPKVLITAHVRRTAGPARDELIEFAATLRFAHATELVAILDRETASEEALADFRDRIANNG